MRSSSLRLLAALAAVAVVGAPASSQERTTDEWLTRPVDEATFEAYLDFFAYSRDLPFDVAVAGDSTSDGVRVQRLSFQSTPGERVTALLFRPAAGDATGQAVVLLHGGVAGGKDMPRQRTVGGMMARAGWTVLAIDLQHYGERSSGLLQTFTEGEKHERLYNQQSTYLSWVAQTVKDVGRSFDFLVAERGIDPERIALAGFSRGAQLGMIVAGADRRFAAVALIHGGHFDRLETGHLPAACPANYIGRISPRPLLMVNGRNDADHLMDTSVLPLQRLAGEPREFRWTDAGHGIVTEEDRAFILEWLRENVP